MKLQHCSRAAIYALVVTVEDARQSNNASAMRSAIADLQVALVLMKTQLADCVSLSAATATRPGLDHSKMPTPSNAIVTDDPKTSVAAASSEASPQKSQEASDTGTLAITFRSQPTPARTGDNQFEVTVTDKDGKPIADADVSLKFYMPAMPSMKMAEMRNTVKLTSPGRGVYHGGGTVGMAGEWDVTIAVMRNGQTLGKKELKLTAQ